VVRTSVRYMGSDRETIVRAFAELAAAQQQMADLSFDALTHPELVELLGQLEVGRRRQPAVEHRIIARLRAEACPQALGGTSLPQVLATGLHISGKEARRRIKEAVELGPRTAMTGQPLAPILPRTAAAQARGRIGAEHVAITRGFSATCPAGWITRPGRTPKPNWPASPPISPPRSCARPPTGWR